MMAVKPNTYPRFLPTAIALAAGLCGLLAATAAAQEPINADIAIVSKTASARHAKVGQLVTFTILATNNGPAPSQLDVFDQPLIGLHMVEETCDRGISPDTPACEYSQVQPGESVTTTVVAEIDGGVGKYATNTACVSNESGLPDPDPSNDCATTTLRIIGSGTSPTASRPRALDRALCALRRTSSDSLIGASRVRGSSHGGSTRR